MNVEIRRPARRRIADSRGDRTFYAITATLLGAVLLVILYPLLYVVSSSFSAGSAILSGKVFLWPVGLSLDGYRMVFRYGTVMTGYLNSIFYTVVGTAISMALTMICAYPLARKSLPYRNLLMFIFTFTMYFSGGLIPSYLQVRSLGLLNTRWALLIPGALSVYNMIIARSFIQSSIPMELIEASQIDGCSDFRFFFTILLPLSKALLAVLVLYYAVAKWNTWYNAFIYLNNRSMYPLQLILREILITNQLDTATLDDPELARMLAETANVMKYSLIVVASAPMLMLYPFIQRFFVKGVMIGSVKG